MGLDGSKFSPETEYIVSRLVNASRAAEGTTLPPKQAGEFRVPLVTNLRLIKTDPYFNGTSFTVGWNTPPVGTKNISQYNLYVIGLVNNRVPVGPYTTQTSPATINVAVTDARPLTIVVQTVLKNGQVSDLSRSPAITTYSKITSIPSGSYAPGTIPLSAIQNGTDGELITWDSSGVVTTMGPGATDEILVGQGAGAEPTFKSRATLDLVEGRANLVTAGDLVEVSAAGVVTESGITSASLSALLSAAVLDAANLATVGAVTFVSAAGTIDEAVELIWDNVSKLLTITQPTAGTPVLVLQTTAVNDDPKETVTQNRVATTDATVTTIHTLTIPATTTVGFNGTIVARRTGGSAGTAEDGAFYTFSGVYKNVAGTATVIGGGPTVTVVGEDQAGWDVTFTPSGTDVAIEVTGAVNNNVTWHMTLRTYTVSS